MLKVFFGVLLALIVYYHFWDIVGMAALVIYALLPSTEAGWFLLGAIILSAVCGFARWWVQPLEKG